MTIFRQYCWNFPFILIIYLKILYFFPLKVISENNDDTFVSSFPIFIPLNFFTYLTILTWIFSIILNSRDTCLVNNIREKVFSYSLVWCLIKSCCFFKKLSDFCKRERLAFIIHILFYSSASPSQYFFKWLRCYEDKLENKINLSYVDCKCFKFVRFYK